MAEDADSGTYFPSAKLRLVVRFDEFGEKNKLAKPPAKSTRVIDGVKDDRAPLVATRDDSVPGVSRFKLAPAGSTAAEPSTGQSRSADDLTFDVTLIPKTADWSQNGLRNADTLTAEFKFIDCPIDPRCVRACAVEYFLGTRSAGDFGAGVAGAGSGDILFLPDADPATGRSFLRFVGWVDKWSVDWTESGEPVVRVECRDTSQLLREQEISHMQGLDINKPLDEAVAQYLSQFPQMYGLTVEYRPAGGKVPVLKDALAGDAFRPGKGTIGGAKGGGGNERQNVMDYLTDQCGSVGHSIRADGTNIVVQTVRSYTTSSVTRRADDPFQGRDLPGGQRTEYRRFMYGRNVKEMRVSRAFSRTTPRNIEVRSWSTGDGKLLSVRVPTTQDMQQTSAIPGNAQPDQKWLVLRVGGIKDKETLLAVARSAYESIGRNELNVEVKTRNLASFGGGNADADLLDMKTGDTVDLLVDQKDTATLNQIEKSLNSNARAKEFMQALGFSGDFASAYAKAFAAAGFLTVFRVRAMKIAWGIDTGVEIDVSGVNYIQARAEGAGEEPGEKANPEPVGNRRTVGP